MAFRVTISGAGMLQKCIESLSFRVDTPNDSNARYDDAGSILEIIGQTGSDEPTIELYRWSLTKTSDSNAYRNVEVQILGNNGKLVREVIFSKAFVVDYYETYSKDRGVGVFHLYLKQKKDKNDAVSANGDIPFAPI